MIRARKLYQECIIVEGVALYYDVCFSLKEKAFLARPTEPILKGVFEELGIDCERFYNIRELEKSVEDTLESFKSAQILEKGMRTPVLIYQVESSLGEDEDDSLSRESSIKFSFREAVLVKLGAEEIFLTPEGSMTSVGYNELFVAKTPHSLEVMEKIDLELKKTVVALNELFGSGPVDFLEGVQKSIALKRGANCE